MGLVVICNPVAYSFDSLFNYSSCSLLKWYFFISLVYLELSVLLHLFFLLVLSVILHLFIFIHIFGASAFVCLVLSVLLHLFFLLLSVILD